MRIPHRVAHADRFRQETERAEDVGDVLLIVDDVRIERVHAVAEARQRDRKHLARIIRTIRRMSDVLRVARTIAAHSSTKGRKQPESKT